MVADLKSGRSVVNPIEILTNEQIELVKSVIEYNRQIDEYVIETFGSQVTEKQFLGAILNIPQQKSVETAATTPRTFQSQTTPQ